MSPVRLEDHTFSSTGMEHRSLSYPGHHSMDLHYLYTNSHSSLVEGVFWGGGNSFGHTSRVVVVQFLESHWAKICKHWWLGNSLNPPPPREQDGVSAASLTGGQPILSTMLPRTQATQNPQVRISLWLVVNREAILEDPILAAQYSI